MRSNDLEYKEYTIIDKLEMIPGMFLFRLAGNLKFKPGQFVQAALDHFGEATFAPCSDPKEKKFFELCIRSCGSTSNGLIQLLPGDKIKIRGPYGNGWPIKKLWWKDALLIAGGMGLVPLRPLLFEIQRERINLGKITLIAGFKSSDHLLFHYDLLKWRDELDQVIGIAEYGQKDKWLQHGLITEPLADLKVHPKETTVFVCGPEVMVPHVNEVLFAKKIPKEQIYISYERRMECGIGICQHCSIGKFLVCKDGPIFRYDQIEQELNK